MAGRSLSLPAYQQARGRGKAGSGREALVAGMPTGGLANGRVNPQLNGLRAAKATYAAWDVGRPLACAGRLCGPQAI